MPATTTRMPGTARRVLALSVPIAVLAMAASLAGVLREETYAAETANWAAQGRGQDVVNVLVAYPALLVSAWMARRGSLRAFLVWLGVLAYSAYSYLLYAGFLHFSGWFLVYVAVLGLSVYALIGGLVALPAARVAAAFTDRAPIRLAGGLLVALGLAFAALWLAEIVPAAIAGEPLPSAVEAGLITNPVHILDLAILLPAMVLTGVLLRRRLPVGYLLAVPLYAFGVVMSAAILGMFASLAAAGEPVVVPVAAVMAVVAGLQVWVLVRMLSTLRAGIDAMGQVEPVSGTAGARG